MADIYEKSLEVLKRILHAQKKEGFTIYLLGDWAVWLYNPYMKSKDIDFIVRTEDEWKLRSVVERLGFRETSKVMEKLGFAMLWDTDKIELDVYTKAVGGFEVTELISDALTKRIDGKTVRVLSPTTLFMLKAFTALERMGTAKGEKDLSDILALLDSSMEAIDFENVRKRLDIRKVLNIVLGDFRRTSRIYPLALERYNLIKRRLKSLGVL